MAYARYTGTVQDLTGNAIENGDVLVIREGTNVAAVIYGDRNAGGTIANPIKTQADGSFFFHAVGGAYRFLITDPKGQTREVRYVGVGLAQESDVTSLVPKGLWDAGTTYEIGDLVTTLTGGSYLLFASKQDDNLNHTPDSTTPGDNAWWQYLGRAAQVVSTGLYVAISDEISTLVTKTAALTVRNYGLLDIIAVRASLTEASTSGPVQVDINVTGVGSILSTKLTIDQNEKTSVTAAVPAVLSVTSIADDSEITFDIDSAGANAKGLKVTIAAKVQ